MEASVAMSAISSAAWGFVGGAMVHWVEFDLEGKVWTVPPAQSPRASIAFPFPTAHSPSSKGDMEAGRTGDYVFPGQRAGRPLSGMAFEMLLRRIGSPYTAHGFRSSFRDWAGNESHFPRELASRHSAMRSATRPSGPTGDRTRWRDGVS